MDLYEYDCLDAVNQFCANSSISNQRDLEPSILSVDISDDELELDESIKKPNKNTNTEEPEKSDVLCISSEDEADVNVPRRLRSRQKKPNQAVANNQVKKGKKKLENVIVIDDILNSTLENSCDLSKSLNTSLEPQKENDNVVLNIQWQRNIEKIPFRKYQKFSELMQVFAEREKCSVNDILLNIDSKILTLNDTPESIDYKFYDIICGRIVPGCNVGISKKIDKNLITLKIQSNIWKKPIEISISKTDKFSILKAKITEEVKLKTEDFILIFDGETLDLNETPEDQDFDGGELIDCKVKNIAIAENTVVEKPKRKNNTRKSTRKK